MKRPLRLPPRAICWLALLWLAAPSHAQVLQDLTANLYSTNYGRGVNFSAQRASDVPANKVLLNGLAATPIQFRGEITYGAVVRPRANATLTPGQNYSQNSVQLDLPRVEVNGTVTLVLRSATVGASTFGRSTTFNFGAVIAPPATDEGGRLLDKPEAYWAAEPHTTTSPGHLGAPYYWSVHAQRVFATQPGPIEITWRAAQPAAGSIAGLNKVTIGGLDYATAKVNYVVGGAATKKPKQLYWTEKTFRSTGKPVAVPTARIGAVYFHYNSAFPRATTTEFVELGSSSITDGGPNAVLQELRTAWYDNAQGLILAYNLQGRVFLELLGDPTAGGARRHLGYEVVDVIKQPAATELTAELGEKLTAYADARPDLDLDPSPVLTGIGGNFTFLDPLGSNGRVDYYAVKETENPNDVLVHWLEAGVEGLRWPLIFARYRQLWPEDPARYSHYLRPAVATQSEAAKTAVPLPADNVPFLQYQDELDQPRGFLDEKSQFYTWLIASQPAHRALLRLNAGERVAFERVLSLLDTQIRPANPDGGSAQQDITVAGPVSGRASFLNLTSGNASLPSLVGLQFNSQSFTVESWVYLRSPADVSRLLNLRIGAKTMEAGLGLNAEVPAAYLDIYGDTQNLTANLNGATSVGGLRFSGDFVPVLDSVDLSNWVAPVFGANSAPAVFNPNPSVAFLFRANGTLEVFENGNNVNAGKNWRPAGDYRNRTNRVDILITDPTPGDNNPFSGGGTSAFAVHLNLNSVPAYTRSIAGLANNFHGVINYTDGVFRTRRITRIADGHGYAVSQQPTPAGRWVHVAMVGESAATKIYLDGQLVGEGVNSQPVIGAVTAGTLGSAGLAMDNFRLWSRARAATEIEADMNTSSPVNKSGLELQFNFNEPGTVASDTSGKSSRDLTISEGSSVGGDPAAPGSLSQTLYPRYVRATVNVGDRIAPPAGEVSLAGYIQQSSGDSFHAVAYKDPFASGFETANAGAIIPINAIPGKDVLEVWWFRQNKTTALKNVVNGFKPIYWPAVLGRYNLAWPDNPANEIVMASNAGSGGLESLQAKGTIYTQNDSTLPGYNPNEEHAVMIGGQAYALRDDLNVTTGSGFSSRPYVLLDYTAADGRPAVRAFKVLREKPGVLFDYVVEAGKQLQAPMPLPLLPAPVEIVTSSTSTNQVNYNSEIVPSVRDLPVGWNDSFSAGVYGHYDNFTYRDRKDGFWVMRGPHSGLPKLDAGRYDAGRLNFVPNVTAGGELNATFTNYIHTSRRIDSLVATVSLTTPLPAGLKFGPLKDGLAVHGTLTTNTGTYTLNITDGDGSAATVTLTLSATTNQQAALNINGRLGRPPTLAHLPDPGQTVPTKAFGMRFYYKTQEGFAWPGKLVPPEVGTIVPYLRPAGSTADSASKTTAALDIIYRPAWPGNAPAVDFGETLTEANKGRPAIRGQTSAKLLYQQGIATNGVNNGEAGAAMILHDPTREKSFSLKSDTKDGLAALPAGVRAELYQGKTFFPNLPPHLAERFFYDSNRSPKGDLVFKGEFKNEALGEKYLLLNVLGLSDLATVKNLCPTADPDKTKWDGAVDALAASVETFYEDPAVPGEFIVNPGMTVSRGVSELVAITNDNTAVDSYALSAAGPGGGFVTVIVGNSGNAKQTPAGEPVSMYVLRVTGSIYRGEIKILESANPLNELITFEHTADLGGKFADYDYEWKIAPPVDGFPPVVDATMSRYQGLTNGADIKRFTLGGSGIRTLVDNYIVMRYRPKDAIHPLKDQWSAWTEPQLAEGWIKRVLAKINPFSQRVTDLYNNSVNTDVSILTQAGKRYEGDIALNMENINSYGLIEIYETVLNRGRNLSVDAGVNFGPANDALLLAAGYINDLYMLVGNEAFADAANPTIGIGTKDKTYGSIATALFAFRGQMPSLLEEELALLRGRDDVALPGVQTAPVYNRLVWNFTRGIDAGEVIYALNYNILDQNSDGKADAADAARLYPQGHGDAYGHYLTAIKGYYSLLANPNFDWVPRVEAVTVLGKPVTVDYLDERKFAAGAASVARAGRQIFDLTWRQHYLPGRTAGWEHFATNRVSSRKVLNGTTETSIVRHWGADQWASRTAQGAFLNWVVGNAILPEVDTDPSHEGIQKVDRTTVPELLELGTTLADLQAATDNAEGRLTPIGLTEGSIAFDLNPSLVVEAVDPQGHFEQVYGRAKLSLNNALAAFDDAKDVTRLMRSEEDSLADLRSTVAEQELSFTNALIEIYGTPYPDDVGPGKTFKQGYEGPDLIHYVYVETPELQFGGAGGYLDPRSTFTLKLDIQDYPAAWKIFVGEDDFLNLGSKTAAGDFDFLQPDPTRNGTNFITYELAPHGYFKKPTAWTGQRRSPGEIQQAISNFIKARNGLASALDDAKGAKEELDGQLRVFKAGQQAQDEIAKLEYGLAIAEQVTATVERASELFGTVQDSIKEEITAVSAAAAAAFPTSLIAGVAAGGDLTAPGRAALLAAGVTVESTTEYVTIARTAVTLALRTANDSAAVDVDFKKIRPIERAQERRELLNELVVSLDELQGKAYAINHALQEYDDAKRAVAALIAKGDRLQAERQVVRQRTAAVIQGFRTRDAAFRIFRNEKLERYKTLFDLASRYAFLAANAYDYDTGLLGTPKGKAFVNRIVSSRALGVVRDGEPQFAGSNTGDPGLSSALAEMKADYDVLKGRLGFNAPDAYNTLASLRTGNLRILPDSSGLSTWQDFLQQSRMDNILEDADVRRYCQQVDSGDGLPVPGIVITFSTSINKGENLFGKSLAAGDNAFHRSYFATKIHSIGVALEGYRGMNYPTKTGTADPNLSYLDPQALSANPYVYLIPTGVDTMRSPPLGDTSELRQWKVDDVAIPLPFNIGGSGFSTKNFYQSADSLTEPLFTIRKHQAFRPADSIEPFKADVYDGTGLKNSQFTNRRLVGRSVWNSQWKLVIPGDTLLADPKEGLSRLIQTLTDIKLYYTTYSYSGN